MFGESEKEQVVRSILGNQSKFLEPNYQDSQQNNFIYSMTKHADEIISDCLIGDKQYKITINFDSAMGYTSPFFFNYLKEYVEEFIISTNFPGAKWKRIEKRKHVNN